MYLAPGDGEVYDVTFALWMATLNVQEAFWTKHFPSPVLASGSSEVELTRNVVEAPAGGADPSPKSSTVAASKPAANTHFALAVLV